MIRLHTVAIAILVGSVLLLAGAAVAGGTVDLNRPGALEALQQSDPDHYAKVKLILEGVARHPDSDVPRWIRVGFDARNVDYAPIVLTSHPAQRRLAFSLDQTRYVAVIVLTTLRGDIVPLR
jgi:hypothetical protein